VRLHPADDGSRLRGQELRLGIQRLRRDDQLRLLSEWPDLRWRRSWDAQRMRLHAADDGSSLCGQELRVGPQRLRWNADQLWWQLSVVSNVRRRRYAQCLRLYTAYGNAGMRRGANVRASAKWVRRHAALRSMHAALGMRT
jgi:hypothetical protein